MEEENYFSCIPRCTTSEKFDLQYLPPDDPLVALSECVGKELYDALRDFVAFYRYRKPSIFPTELLSYYRDGSLYSRINMVGANAGVHGISIILEKVDLTVMIEEDDQVIDVVFPNQIVTEHLPAAKLESIACASSGKIQKISGVYGTNIVDYVTRKYNGQSIHNYAIMTDYNMYGLAHYDGDIVFNSYEAPFSGEIVGTKIYFQHAYEADGPICLNNKFYHCVASERVMSLATAVEVADSDGMVFCINSIEYNVKEVNTINLINNGTDKFSTSDGFTFYGNNTSGLTSRIVECEVLESGDVRPVVSKNDTVQVHSMKECMVLIDAPTLADVRNIFSENDIAVGGGVFYAPFSVCADIVHQALNYFNGKAVLSHMLITAILHEKGVYVDANVCREVLHELGVEDVIGVVYANRPIVSHTMSTLSVKEIYDILVEYGVAGTVHEMGVYLGIKLGYIVNSLDLWYMYRNRMFKVRHNKCVELNKWDISKLSYDLLPRYWLDYGQNNDRDNVEMVRSVTLETKNMFVVPSHLDVPDELGSAILLLCKYIGITNCYVNVGSLFALSMFSSFKDIYKSRIIQYGCVRDHNTADSHICSNRNRFLGKID